VARAKSIGIRETLTSLLPKGELEHLAYESGMVRRRRKVDPSAMLWTLVLAFATGRERTLAGLRRMYQRATGTSLVPSAFYDRFTPELVRFLRGVVGELCARLAAHEPACQGVLSKFTDVVVTDTSVVKLHRLLTRRYPGTRTNSNPAAAKLHLVMSVMGKGLEKVKLTGERASDHRTLRMGPWVAGRLLLFDLGYFRYQLFDCIDRNGGSFLTRIPAGANPLIVGVNRKWRGRSVALEGKRLDEVAGKLRRMTLDAEVEVEFPRRVYAGKRRTHRRRFRLIGVRDPNSANRLVKNVVFHQPVRARASPRPRCALTADHSPPRMPPRQRAAPRVSPDRASPHRRGAPWRRRNVHLAVAAALLVDLAWNERHASRASRSLYDDSRRPRFRNPAGHNQGTCDLVATVRIPFRRRPPGLRVQPRCAAVPRRRGFATSHAMSRTSSARRTFAPRARSTCR